MARTQATKPPEPTRATTPTKLGQWADAEAGSAFLPAGILAEREAAPVSRVPSTVPFQLMMRDDRWIAENGRVVPNPWKMAIVPGLNGVDISPKGKVMFLAARGDQEGLGWRAIPFDTVAPSVAAKMDAAGQQRSYAYRPRGRPDVNLCYWEHVFSGSDTVEINRAEFYEWVEHALATGAIVPPKPHTLRLMLGEENKKFEKATAEATKNPALMYRVELHRKNIAAIEEALTNAEATVRRQAEAGEAAGVEFE